MNGALPSASEQFPMPFGEDDDYDPEEFLKQQVQPTHGSQYTAKWCIDLASKIFGVTDLAVAANQGGNSLSLITKSNTVFVQVRLLGRSSSGVQDASTRYPEWVPSHEVHKHPPFELHKCRVMPGIPLIKYGGFYDHTGADPGLFHRVWVLGTIIGRSTSPHRNTDSSVIQSIDDALATVTAPELQHHRTSIHNRLSQLRALPIALTHNDLLPHNILVDPRSARVTAIVDWHDATYYPFGCDLWTLDLLLAVEQPECWGWNQSKAKMEDVFWNAMWEAAPPKLRGGKQDKDFKQALKTAKDLGILLRFGASRDCIDWRTARRINTIIECGTCHRYLTMTS